MKERPILFSAPMVRAVLDGTKTQTRRVVAVANSLVNGGPPCRREEGVIESWHVLEFDRAWIDNGPSPAGNPGPYLKVPGGDESVQRVYSRVQPGDQLWVRETHAVLTLGNKTLCAYRAHSNGDTVDYVDAALDLYSIAVKQWTPAIHMPRYASRITLEVTDVRVQRLRDITEDDALAEGCTGETAKQRHYFLNHDFDPCVPDPRAQFCDLWDSLNRKRPGCAWADNPWVWAITFRRLQP